MCSSGERSLKSKGAALTDRQEETPHDVHGPEPAGGERRPYARPELIEYGTVAKLTQTGSGSVNDIFGMMMAMTCL